MFVTGAVPIHVASIKWQDYRGHNTGVCVFYSSDPVSELPIREIPEELPSDISAEPNYETGTYGVYGCTQPRLRSSFAKKKHAYLLFMTRYNGTNLDLTDELMVTGFYHINQIADTQKLHIRYLDNYSCISDKSCVALRADSMHFVAPEDAFMISAATLEKWGASSRVTRMTRVTLTEEQTMEIVDFLQGKANCKNQYCEITEDLMPTLDDDE